MVTFTAQEFYDKTGQELNMILEQDADSQHAKRFIDFICREIDRYIRTRNPRLIRRGYDSLSEYQTNTLKDACIQHALNVYQTGHTYIADNGLPKRIPIAEDVKEILSPLVYRGL